MSADVLPGDVIENETLIQVDLITQIERENNPAIFVGQDLGVHCYEIQSCYNVSQKIMIQIGSSSERCIDGLRHLQPHFAKIGT